ncbi:MAG: hypothetical protein GXP28_03150 [Planctomycetes bacterium]|nr:hypothetical protein [Planctomycetota bacterium]
MIVSRVKQAVNTCFPQVESVEGVGWRWIVGVIEAITVCGRSRCNDLNYCRTSRRVGSRRVEPTANGRTVDVNELPAKLGGQRTSVGKVQALIRA